MPSMTANRIPCFHPLLNMLATFTTARRSTCCTSGPVRFKVLPLNGITPSRRKCRSKKSKPVLCAASPCTCRPGVAEQPDHQGASVVLGSNLSRRATKPSSTRLTRPAAALFRRPSGMVFRRSEFSFPAPAPDFDSTLLRHLIEGDLIPAPSHPGSDPVAGHSLIERRMEGLRGRAPGHMSTSTRLDYVRCCSGGWFPLRQCRHHPPDRVSTPSSSLLQQAGWQRCRAPMSATSLARASRTELDYASRSSPRDGPSSSHNADQAQDHLTCRPLSRLQPPPQHLRRAPSIGFHHRQRAHRRPGLCCRCKKPPRIRPSTRRGRLRVRGLFPGARAPTGSMCTLFFNGDPSSPATRRRHLALTCIQPWRQNPELDISDNTRTTHARLPLQPTALPIHPRPPVLRAYPRSTPTSFLRGSAPGRHTEGLLSLLGRRHTSCGAVPYLAHRHPNPVGPFVTSRHPVQQPFGARAASRTIMKPELRFDLPMRLQIELLPRIQSSPGTRTESSLPEMWGSGSSHRGVPARFAFARLVSQSDDRTDAGATVTAPALSRANPVREGAARTHLRPLSTRMQKELTIDVDVIYYAEHRPHPRTAPTASAVGLLEASLEEGSGGSSSSTARYSRHRLKAVWGAVKTACRACSMSTTPVATATTTRPKVARTVGSRGRRPHPSRRTTISHNLVDSRTRRLGSGTSATHRRPDQ